MQVVDSLALTEYMYLVLGWTRGDGRMGGDTLGVIARLRVRSRYVGTWPPGGKLPGQWRHSLGFQVDCLTGPCSIEYPNFLDPPPSRILPCHTEYCVDTLIRR